MRKNGTKYNNFIIIYIKNHTYLTILESDTLHTPTSVGDVSNPLIHN